MKTRRTFIGGAAAAGLAPLIGTHGAMAGGADHSGWVLLDVESGEVLEATAADLPAIPASTVKSLTTYAALAAFRPTDRFETAVFGAGEISNGTLRGDLSLVGGGDPTLDTGDLAGLVETLRQRGVSKIGGRFLYDGSALPQIPILNESQPRQAGYNPGISGLNLNFNRVLLRWRGGGGDLHLTSEAMADGKSVRAEAISFTASATARTHAHRLDASGERWTVPRSLLSKPGRRWFPVRDPARYAASVFRTLCHEAGISLPAPVAAARDASARPLAVHRSDPIYGVLVRMMKFSNNLTAETLGIAAARRLSGVPSGLSDAARRNAAWLQDDLAAQGMALQGQAILENHSGLSTESRLTPHQLATVLRAGVRRHGRGFVTAHARGTFDDLPNTAPFWSKTGTMHFVRGRVGFLERRGRLLAFAILSMQPERRAAVDLAFSPFDDSRPAGARQWNRRAVAQETRLLKKWIQG